MKTISVSALIAALAGLSQAASFTNTKFDVTPGSTFTLKWTAASGPVTIALETGPSTDKLQPIQNIDSNDSGTSFTWTVPTTLVTGLYAFKITDSTGSNFSASFTLTGTGSASASASTIAASATSATTAVSSATTVKSSSAAPSSSTAKTTTTTAASSSASGSSTGSVSSASTSASTATSASKTTSASASATTTPPSNAAQNVVAPFIAPLLVAAGVALI